MGVLQDFERRLEGAVEGFFARAFRSALQPVELAKAVQRYAEDHRTVTTDGVVVANEYAVSISPSDHERLASYDNLSGELRRVIVDTAQEKSWHLRGPVLVTITADDSVRQGRHLLTGRVHGTAPAPVAAPTPTPEPFHPPSPAHVEEPDDLDAATPRLIGVDSPATLHLVDDRLIIGRLPSCALVLDDDTISRTHAIVVRRDNAWWILDQGSTNGTRINGRRVGESKLKDRDEVELGDVRMIFRGA